MPDDDDRPFPFLKLNRREQKPRQRGITEIRGPYYAPVGPTYLEEILEAWSAGIDTVKYAGGSFALMPRRSVRALNDTCHRHQVAVSTGGFIEYVLTQGPSAVDRYLGECQELGFDIVEISSGFLAIAEEDLIRLTHKVRNLGLRAKPEVGIQYGAGGATETAALEAEGTRDVGSAIHLARRHLEAGATLIMVESEGITENVRSWRTDAIARLVEAVGLAHLMFEAADPPVFSWYVKSYGPDVNLFVDHSQIVQLECLRAGIWGPQSLWGRVVQYR